jgi:cytochrome c553
MTTDAPRRLGKFLRWALAGLAGVAVAMFLIAWSGIFNVAASRGHWAVVDWFLAFAMRNSVELRANAITAPPLDSPDLIRLGAGHFHGGCAFCHGAPGIPVSPIAHHMLPSPPDLTTSMRPWKDEELFWIVQHGIKYTGMPSWVALEREDEIWAVVAFLKQIPTMDARSYDTLALGGVRIPGQSGEKLATVESNPQGAGACARCHGAEGSGPASALVPVLHGQPAEFLMTALQQYAEGARRSGIMQPLAAELGAQDMRQLAEYYAKLTPPKTPPRAADGALTERGRLLAAEGDTGNGVPACNACHGRDALARYPRLAGQNAAYMAGQLRLWKAGHHTSTGGAAIMAPIARRLSDGDIDAVASYLSGLAADPVRASRP